MIPEYIHTSNIIWTQQVILGDICIYKHIYTCNNIDENRDYGCEEEWGGISRNIWREKKREILKFKHIYIQVGHFKVTV